MRVEDTLVFHDLDNVLAVLGLQISFSIPESLHSSDETWSEIFFINVVGAFEERGSYL